MPHKAVVTGATGFIGSYLVESLVEKGWDVSCPVRDSSRTDLLEKLPVSLIRGAMDDKAFLKQALKNRDYIFHLAAAIHASSSTIYEQANYLLTRDLVNVCLEANPAVKRFVYVSSIAAAGPSEKGHIADETGTRAPVSEYGRTKLKGEEAVIHQWDSLVSTIIRPPNVYGPRQRETDLLIKLIGKKIVPALKPGIPLTSLIYIKDLVQGIIQAALSPKAEKQIYYLTDGNQYSWQEILLTIKNQKIGHSLYLPLPEFLIAGAAGIADLLKKSGSIKTMFGSRAWKTIRETPWLFSSDKAVRDFGFCPAYSLEKGIRETVENIR